MRSLLLGGVNVAAFMLCATFLAYVVCIIVPLLRHRRGPIGDPTKFGWHFLIPCLNEEQVIAGTVSDLFKKFPTADIWCIDDGSTDATHQIVSRLASRSGQVHVVARRLPDAQQGKGPALNAGWKALVDHLPPDADLDRIIVGVIDADGILDRRCPTIISGSTLFGDPKVSAVQILVRVVNQAGAQVSARARLLTRMQDIEFSCVIAGMQMLRRHVGSTAMGGNGQFTRLSALQKVTETYGTPWERALLEDFELGLRILLTGGRTEYCHDTWVAQQGPPTVGRLIRQRSRWAQGLMQCFRYFLPVMRSPKVSTAGALEIAVFLLLPWFQLFGILVYLVSLVVLIYWALATTGGPLHWFGAGAWGLIPLFVLFGLGPLVLWGPIYRRTTARDLSLTQAALLGLANWPYSYIHHVSTWWAFGRMVRSRHDWKKTERLDVPQQPAKARPRPGAAPAQPRPAGVPARLRPAMALAGGPGGRPGRGAGAPQPASVPAWMAARSGVGGRPGGGMAVQAPPAPPPFPAVAPTSSSSRLATAVRLRQPQSPPGPIRRPRPVQRPGPTGGQPRAAPSQTMPQDPPLPTTAAVRKAVSGATATPTARGAPSPAIAATAANGSARATTTRATATTANGNPRTATTAATATTGAATATNSPAANSPAANATHPTRSGTGDGPARIPAAPTHTGNGVGTGRGAGAEDGRPLPLMAAGKLRVGNAAGRSTTRARRRAASGGGVHSVAPVVGGRLRLAPPAAALAATGRGGGTTPD